MILNGDFDSLFASKRSKFLNIEKQFSPCRAFISRTLDVYHVCCDWKIKSNESPWWIIFPTINFRVFHFHFSFSRGVTFHIPQNQSWALNLARKSFLFSFEFFSIFYFVQQQSQLVVHYHDVDVEHEFVWQREKYVLHGIWLLNNRYFWFVLFVCAQKMAIRVSMSSGNEIKMRKFNASVRFPDFQFCHDKTARKHMWIFRFWLCDQGKWKCTHKKSMYVE